MFCTQELGIGLGTRDFVAEEADVKSRTKKYSLLINIFYFVKYFFIDF